MAIKLKDIALRIANSGLHTITGKCSICGKFKAEKELPSGELVCPDCLDKYRKTLCVYCQKYPGIWRTNWGKYICDNCFSWFSEQQKNDCECICEYCGKHRADRIDRQTGMKLCPDCLRKVQINRGDKANH